MSVPRKVDTAAIEQAVALSLVDPIAAGRALAAIRRADPGCLEAHNALERLDAIEAMRQHLQVNCVIDPRDDIYRFFAGHPDACNPIREYIGDGWRTLAQLMLVLERVGRPLLGFERVLEFGAGFGRFTRHLARAMPGRVTCSEVVPGAVEFLKREFGVDGFESGWSPEQIRFPGRYDLVFVLSVFTHLPPPRWEAWLRALAGVVSPGGLLVFSVHNEAFALHEGVRFESDGTRFLASSESQSLSPELYGTTFTTRNFVRAEVERCLGMPPLEIQERAFWVGQDAVIVKG